MIKLDYVNDRLITTSEKRQIKRLNITVKVVFNEIQSFFKKLIHTDSSKLNYAITDNFDLNHINRRIYEIENETNIIKISIGSKVAYILVWTALGIIVYRNNGTLDKVVSSLCFLASLTNGISCYCKNNILSDYKKEEAKLKGKRQSYFDV